MSYQGDMDVLWSRGKVDAMAADMTRVPNGGAKVVDVRGADGTLATEEELCSNSLLQAVEVTWRYSLSSHP